MLSIQRIILLTELLFFNHNRKKEIALWKTIFCEYQVLDIFQYYLAVINRSREFPKKIHFVENFEVLI